MSAYAARASDVLRIVGYKGPIAMCWEDVELVLDLVADRPPSV